MSATRDGRDWVPGFLTAIDAETCIGCGRCFKVCGQGVFTLMGIDEDDAIVALDDDDDEIERKVMVLTDPGACIGCRACARVCPKKCQTHEPLPQAA